MMKENSLAKVFGFSNAQDPFKAPISRESLYSVLDGIMHELET